MIKHTYLEFFNEGSGHKNLKINYEGNKQITNTQIREESMKIVESISSSDELKFGTLVASSFDIQLAIDTDNLTNAEIELSINVNHDTDNEFKIGKYKVVSDKPSSDRTYKSIKAYDSLYDIVNADVSSWYESQTFPLSLKKFRDSFFAEMGVEQVSTTLINDDMQIEKTISANVLSGRQVLSAICEINGAFGKINRDGKFVYVILDVNPSERIEISNYVNGISSYEDYETATIDKVQIRQETNDIGATVGEGVNCYVVQDNFLVYGKTSEELNAIGNNLLTVIKGISYRPFYNIKTFGNPCYETGDAVKIITRNATINSYILNRTLSGIQALRDTYTANGVEKYTEKVNSYDSEVKQLKRQTNILERTVEETKSTITSIETIAEEANQNAQTALDNADEALSTATAFDERITTNESNISQQATQIESKVSKTDYTGEEIASLINQTAESIKIIAKHLQLEGVITANGTFEVDTDGNIKATGGRIGGFNIDANSLSANGLNIISKSASTKGEVLLYGDLEKGESSVAMDVDKGFRLFALDDYTVQYKTIGNLGVTYNENSSNVWPASKLNLGKISSADRNYLETISADGYTGDIKATGSIVANSVKTSSGADLDTLNDSLANRKILSSIQYITISGTGQITDKSLDFEIPVGYSVLSSVDVAVKGSGYFTVTPTVTISNGKYYINKWYSLLNNTTSETIQSIVYFISNDHLENTP